MSVAIINLVAVRQILIVVLLAAPLSSAPHADLIVVHKRAHTMELMHAGQVLRTYKVYVIDSRNAHSQFHRSLHISYPNAGDRDRARKLGVSPGGDIMIHDLPNGYGFISAAHRAHDWTDGCIAVTDHEIEEIWKLVPNGTPVEIRP